MLLEWEYTRSQRTHYINDGEYYGYRGERHWRLWEICSSAPYGGRQGKHGYDLYHASNLVTHGKTVKELKIYVAQQEASIEAGHTIYERKK